MGRPVIVLGDATDHGGQVISGDMTANVEGKPIARVGDMVSCPKCNGTFPIIEGVMDTIFSTQPVAVHGHKTACGATLIGSQTLLLIHVEAGNTYQSAPAGTKTSPSARAYTPATADSLAANNSSSSGEFDQHFQLLDELTGEVLANRFYRIHTPSGIIEGRTGADGLTKKVASKHADKVEIEIYPEGH
ncbi:PAAR domain-containing protein [Chitinimonas sp. PSY-7]|uniref:PAAR domain-containing protein n=1 Tax=Chitinimonas sp. PSY-7 TaxID=3459088 RepID=UPI00403FE4E8